MAEPRMIVEVLSGSTEAYDRGEKFEKYRQFKFLAEYALINPIKRKAEIFRRDATDHCVLHEHGRDDPVFFASLELTIASSILYENVRRSPCFGCRVTLLGPPYDRLCGYDHPNAFPAGLAAPSGNT